MNCRSVTPLRSQMPRTTSGSAQRADAAAASGVAADSVDATAAAASAGAPRAGAAKLAVLSAARVRRKTHAE